MGKASYRKEVNKKKRAGDELTTVRGIVIPADWDEEGNVLAVAISSPNEQEYFVEQDSKGKELLGVIRQEIEASGIITKAMKGRNIIAVRSFSLKAGGDW